MEDWRKESLHRLAANGESPAAVFDTLARAARMTGFAFCSVGLQRPLHLAPAADEWHTTYPDDWQGYYYAHQCFRADPVLHGALRSPRPVVWNEDAANRNNTFWSAAYDHGIRHGWTLALRGPDGATLLVSLARPHTPLSGQELGAKEERLLWLAHGALACISAQAQDETPPPELTPREHDVLQWTAAGKTADEVAIILGIAERTVNFHVANILHKLNVVNKPQAVAQAIYRQLLD